MNLKEKADIWEGLDEGKEGEHSNCNLKIKNAFINKYIILYIVS